MPRQKKHLKQIHEASKRAAEKRKQHEEEPMDAEEPCSSEQAKQVEKLQKLAVRSEV